MAGKNPVHETVEHSSFSNRWHDEKDNQTTVPIRVAEYAGRDLPPGYARSWRLRTGR